LVVLGLKKKTIRPNFDTDCLLGDHQWAEVARSVLSGNSVGGKKAQGSWTKMIPKKQTNGRRLKIK